MYLIGSDLDLRITKPREWLEIANQHHDGYQKGWRKSCYETRSSLRDSEHSFHLTQDFRPGLSSVAPAGLRLNWPLSTTPSRN